MDFRGGIFFLFFGFDWVGFEYVVLVIYIRGEVRLSRYEREDFGDGDGDDESGQLISQTSQSGWYIRQIPFRYMKEKGNEAWVRNGVGCSGGGNARFYASDAIFGAHTEYFTTVYLQDQNEFKFIDTVCLPF